MTVDTNRNKRESPIVHNINPPRPGRLERSLGPLHYVEEPGFVDTVHVTHDGRRPPGKFRVSITEDGFVEFISAEVDLRIDPDGCVTVKRPSGRQTTRLSPFGDVWVEQPDGSHIGVLVDGGIRHVPAFDPGYVPRTVYANISSSAPAPSEPSAACAPAADGTDDRQPLATWAEGSVTLMAAVELLRCALGGRLLDGPWVRRDGHGRAWLDPTVAERERGGLSGGERRVLSLAMSLVSGDHPVDLGDAITGLDPATTAVVLRVLADAAGVTNGGN